MSEVQNVIQSDYHFPSSSPSSTGHHHHHHPGSDDIHDSLSDMLILPDQKSSSSGPSLLNIRKRSRTDFLDGQVPSVVSLPKLSTSLHFPVPLQTKSSLISAEPSHGGGNASSNLAHLDAHNHFSSLNMSSPAPASYPSSPINQHHHSHEHHSHSDSSLFNSSSNNNTNGEVSAVAHKGHKKTFSKIPLEDVVALREFLRQVDLTRYGFRGHSCSDSSHEDSECCSPVYNASHHHHHHSGSGSRSFSHYSSLGSDLGANLSSPRDDGFYADDDYEPYKSPRISALAGRPIKTPITSFVNSKLKTIRKSSSPLPSSGTGGLPSPTSSTSSSGGGGGSSSSLSTTHVPYKGKYGSNPVCASCRTTKTPYWRDAWHQGILLCNACGLRFAKFKRRCTSCHYVPRKDDKGGRCCPLCKGAWTQ